MAHTPLMDLVGAAAPRKMSRRAFLSVAAAGMVSAAVPASVASARVVVVGAGLAGMAAAWTLKKSGLKVLVYEASGRSGGRVMSARNAVVEGLISELGASFINSTDAALLGLVREFRLSLDDFAKAGEKPVTYLIRGQRYSEAQVVAALRPVISRAQRDASSLGDDVLAGARGKAVALDWTPLSAYFDRIGLSGWLRDVLETAYVCEYGSELDEQSALNFLLQVGSPGAADFDGLAMAGVDERYIVRGGNQRVPDELRKRLEQNLHFGHRLEAIRPRGDGWRLAFARDNGPLEVDADAVVLAVPFTTLRNVDMSRVKMPGVKRRLIAELGMGQGAKIICGYAKRAWPGHLLIREAPFQMAWDDSFLQPAPGGALTFFQGGLAALGAGSGAVKVQAARVSEGIAGAFPEVEPNGRAARMHWPTHPFSRGSYSCYRPGQWTSFRGLEGKPIGTIYFAGEQCSVDSQGYMNGAVETGQAAARAIIGTVW